MKALLLLAFFAFCANGMAATSYKIGERPFPSFFLADVYPSLENMVAKINEECGGDANTEVPEELMGHEAPTVGYKKTFFYGSVGKIDFYYKCKGG